MNLIELQNILGERIKIAVDKNIPADERKKEAEISKTVASLAKQMINNADIVIRADKLVADGNIKNPNIVRLVADNAISKD